MAGGWISWPVCILLTGLLISSNLSATSSREGDVPRAKPLLIAHRGSSAHAPEHTLPAYRLAIEQGSDFVEPDLQMTRDGVLICLHDSDLARTTNVAEVFPDRATQRDPEGRGSKRTGWFAIDFSVAEIKQLDAGSWFNRANPFAAKAEFVGLKIPTLEEMIVAVGSRAGIYPETKYHEFYDSMGLDMIGALIKVLNRSGYDTEEGRERVFIQSFTKSSLLRLKQAAPLYRRIQLLPMEDPGRREDTKVVTAELAAEIAAYAHGAGPSKSLIRDAQDVRTFQSAGLAVHSYTFRGPTTPVHRLPPGDRMADGLTVRQAIVNDIKRYLEYGIDGGFTDYPDLWLEAARAAR